MIRRRDLLLRSAACLALPLAGCAGRVPGGGAGSGVADRGIGGTGISGTEQLADRGIGGTGIVGTLQRFGSIVVNDRRVQLPGDMVVTEDGRRVTGDRLTVGQSLAVLARAKPEGGLEAAEIRIEHLAVGLLERMPDGGFLVAGQRLVAYRGPGDHLSVGLPIAISGLRQGNGGILVTGWNRPVAPGWSVTGRVTSREGRALILGGGIYRLVAGPYPAAGERIRLTGEVPGIATGWSPAPLVPFADLARLSLESLVDATGNLVDSDMPGLSIDGDFAPGSRVIVERGFEEGPDGGGVNARSAESPSGRGRAGDANAGPTGRGRGGAAGSDEAGASSGAAGGSPGGSPGDGPGRPGGQGGGGGPGSGPGGGGGSSGGGSSGGGGGSGGGSGSGSGGGSGGGGSGGGGSGGGSR